MKKSILLSAVLALSLTAASIDFKEASTGIHRIIPNQHGSILSYHEAIKNTTNSIVHIATTQKPVNQMMNQMHPFFEQFFGPQYMPKKAPKRHGLGSGVIVTNDGYIITNNHVIDDAEEIIVTLPDSAKEYEAKVIGKDPKSDIAVIKIDAEGLNPIVMGSSSNLKVGDVVFAIGNPFGVGQSVTQGIISAQHKTGVGINEYENFIQTDASINPGNSGGALLDSRGALIGINTAIITRSGGNNGIGFAIEIDMVKNIAKKLVEHGSIERGYLGVGIGDMTKELRKLYKHQEGAILNEVYPDTPAEKAGLKRGDLIVKVNGKAVESSAALKNQIGLYMPGIKIEVTYERDRELLRATVKLDKLAESKHEGGAAMIEGLSLSKLDEQTRRQYRISQNVEGVLVTEVEEGSEAARQGIRRGDVIIQIEQWAIDELDDVKEIFAKSKGSYKRVYITRNGRVFIVALK
ncbi:MAG: Do family serine endopeptidase [Campylobacterota bacterium]|nr:Do family serine endopeptidase [Campylobacterota bacterium]